MFDLLISVRPKQWAKNVLVFAGVIFGGQLLDRPSVVAAAAAFVGFCLLSSAVYLVNDIVDQDADRRHPLKALRPIAAGTLRVSTAAAASAVLVAAGLFIAFRLDRTFAEIAILYVVLMALYVGRLKHVVLVDVLVISAGFLLRAWAGAAVVHVPVSHWLLTLTLLLAMFLGLSKRRSELLSLADDASAHRRALLGYNVGLLDGLIATVAGSTVVAYVLYTVSAETVARFGTRRLLLTLPFPAVGIGRYLYLVYVGAGGSDPSEHLLSDLPLLTCVAFWVVAVGFIIYGR